MLASLGEHLREETRDLMPFQRHALGELGAAELRALESAAESSPYAARALELHRPLATDEQNALLDKIDATLGAPASVPAMSTIRVPAAAVPADQGGGLAKVVKLRVLAPLALAAGLGLFVMNEARRGDGDLPRYAMVATGGESELRGSGATEQGASALRVRAGSRFELVLRPATPIAGPVAARAFVVRPAGTMELTDANVEVSSEGSVRIRGVMPEAADANAIVALVGRPAAVKSGLPAQRGAHAFSTPLVVIRD